MKFTFRRLISCFVFVLAAAAAVAQNRIGFAYDEAGNRVRREMVIPSQNAPKSQKPQAFHDAVAGHAISVKSTPDGIVKVTVLDFAADDSGAVDVFTTGAIHVFSQNIPGPETIEIDLRGQAQGTYLLAVTVNGQTTTWKIYKN